MADFLTLDDLYSRANPRKVNAFFDDDNNGVISSTDPAVDAVLSAAEAEMYARLMRAYPGDPSDPAGPIRRLVDNDPALKGHCIFVALQLASERRTEFTSDDGTGSFQKQWERAIDYFETLSKGLKRSRGETAAGKGANTGGKLQPKPPAATSCQFIFAPSKNSPGGHGGF